MPNPYGGIRKIGKVQQKPQHPVSIQKAIKILQKLAINGHSPVSLRVDIYNESEIDIILTGLPLMDDDIIET